MFMKRLKPAENGRGICEMIISADDRRDIALAELSMGNTYGDKENIAPISETICLWAQEHIMGFLLFIENH